MKQIENENEHSASGYGHPIGVECECGRRGLIPLDRIAQRGDMQYLREFKLICRECGSRTWTGFLFTGPLQVEAFQDGADLADVYCLRYAHLPPDDPRVIYCLGGPNPYRVPVEQPTGQTDVAEHV